MRIGNAYAAARKDFTNMMREYSYNHGGFDGFAPALMIQTTAGVPMSAAVLDNYLRSLINLFFKILPLKESGERSLETYMKSLQAELLGCNALVEAIHDDSMFLSLASICNTSSTSRL